MKVKISEIKANSKNPRVIKNEKFQKLVTSIKEFPEMLEKRPLVCFTDVDGKYVVLGGNMRLKAAQEIGLKELPILLADDWTQEQRDEFLIKDNIGFGEWDYDQLANEWNTKDLVNWGMDLNFFNETLQPKNGENPEMEITEEILEQHNYVVFIFDNELDWQVIKETFAIKTVSKAEFTETYKQKGIGRVQKGQKLLDIIHKR